jgi:hypothetical protein
MLHLQQLYSHIAKPTILLHAVSAARLPPRPMTPIPTPWRRRSETAPQTEPATPVPEPQTFVMLMLGLVVLGFASRRRQGSEKFSDE